MPILSHFLSRRDLLREVAATVALSTCSTAALAQNVQRPELGLACGKHQFYDLAPFDRISAQLRLRPDVILLFLELDDGWHGRAFEGVWQRSLKPMLTFSLKQGRSLERTVQGEFDRRIKEAAKATRAMDVYVRPFHEMNGEFGTSWGAKDPGLYKAAWRHFRNVWRGSANHAPFFWSPNVVLEGNKTLPFDDYYPGDDECEFVGLDGYRSRYPILDFSFEKTFGPSLKKLSSLSAHPIFICEVGSPLSAGTQANWIADMFSYLASSPFNGRIFGLNWWNRDEYQLTEPTSLTAMADGVEKWRKAYSLKK